MMVHNFGKGAGRTASELGLRSVCLERHEPTRCSLVEWVLGFLEGYPLTYPRVELPHPLHPQGGHPRAPRPNSGFD
jgi:hypothetical protein